ncbi:MAG TPA: hypothetical protein VFN03_08940, partial [Trueperaceae bacterium]|nr:hypothetical protein [Trueperaceae bacterium]
VLIYAFAGRPTVGTGSLSSERILNVLSATVKRSVDGERGTVVVALPSGASLVAPGEAVVDDQFVLQALEAVLDAQRHEIVHGDITPSRILYAKGRVYLEGYGVPWRASGPRPVAGSAGSAAQGGAGEGPVGAAPSIAQALHVDLQAVVRALLELAGDGLSAEVAVSLRSALAAGSYPPMTAQRLFSIVKRLSGGAVSLPTAGFTDLTLPVTPGHDPLQSSPGTVPARAGPDDGTAAASPAAKTSTPGARPSAGTGAAGTSTPRPTQLGSTSQPRTQGHAGGPAAGPGAPQRPRPTTGAGAYPTDPDPITLNSDPGIAPLHEAPSSQGGEFTPRDTSPGFVKDLPPGATYRPGNLEDSLRPAPFRFERSEERAARVRSWRGPALLLLLFLTAALAAYLAFMANQTNEPSPAGLGLVQHTIDVSVSPTNLPPVSLVVDQSPPGSTYRPGTVMGSVPRKVPFDVPGTWVVHAVFRDRVTDSVTVVVPDDRAITLVFPPVTSNP